MAKTPSNMVALGLRAPSFRLPDTNTLRWEGVEKAPRVSLEDFRGKPGLLVAFLCNHCPFVKHIRSDFARLAAEWIKQGLAVVAISSNDVVSYPEDGPDKMWVEAHEGGYGFPYLYDESQEVAQAFQAACTPDFFLFDGEQRLVYRGQLDSSRPGTGQPVTGQDLGGAVKALLVGKIIDSNQLPSIGCNIKWKAGNEPKRPS
jgi:peroxiredoxin